MENLVPLGTGNSRLMKSNIPASTTLAQLIQMLNNGTFPYDIGPLNSAGISQQGTPLNKATLFSDQTMAKYPTGIEDPNDAFEKLAEAALVQKTNTPMYQEITVDLSTAQEGDIVKLPENGKLVDFYVAKLNYESGLNGTGRVLLVRKIAYDQRQWHSSNVNAWENCSMRSWLNSTYKSLLGSDIQTAMGTTAYRYTPGNGNNNVTTRSDSVFLLSMAEMGRSNTYANVEGSALPIASTLIALYQEDGSFGTQWTRSPYTGASADGRVWVIGSNGSDVRAWDCSVIKGSRPVFTLPSTFTATYYVDDKGNFYDEQEYASNNSLTDLFGNKLMGLPGPQIYTGSYTGTGTYGSSNPNTLTFPFEPKAIIFLNRWYSNSAKQLAVPVTFSAEFLSSQYSNVIVQWGSNLDQNFYASLSGNSFSFYSTSSAFYQMNESGRMYFYLAIG